MNIACSALCGVLIFLCISELLKAERAIDNKEPDVIIVYCVTIYPRYIK